jgi:hypothetical protein
MSSGTIPRCGERFFLSYSRRDWVLAYSIEIERAIERYSAREGRRMKLNVESLIAGLDYHGEVHGKRQHYYVLSSARQYFVMSISLSKRDAGYFNLVSKSAVEKLYRRLRGQQGITAKLVFTRSKSRRMVPSALAALNMLYVLVATDRASIDGRHKSREIFFNIKP